MKIYERISEDTEEFTIGKQYKLLRFDSPGWGRFEKNNHGNEYLGKLGYFKEVQVTNEDLIAAIKGTPKTGLSSAQKSALEFVMSKEAVPFAPAVDPKEEEKKLRDSLTALQILLTDITKGSLPSSGINHVISKYPEDTWTEEHKVNIPEVDPYYQWDADVLEALWLGHLLNEKVLCTGPPGTGKTTATQQLAAILRQPWARFNGKDGIEASAFLGYVWATKDGMEWRDGLVPICVREGYLTVIDEVFKLPPGIQMAFQSLYEKGGYLMLDEKPGTIKDKQVHPRKEFRLIGTDNTKGTGDGIDMYAAGQMQDISSLDRFTITIDVNYMKPEVETKMLQKKYPKVDKKSVKKSVTMANLVREAFMHQGDLSLTLSPRGLFTVCELMNAGLDLNTSIRLAYVNKLGDDREVQVCEKFLTSAI